MGTASPLHSHAHEQPDSLHAKHFVEPGLKNKVENSVFVRTLEEAADLIERRGFSIRMGCPGKRASLICPKSIVPGPRPPVISAETVATSEPSAPDS